mmetsp:Transcript_2607/g.6081  ORF Transcript_2607/g.6081 Transcript_2607/m.6081 type:complete len:508 (+) Transcript_2607:41-1564(+)
MSLLRLLASADRSLHRNFCRSRVFAVTIDGQWGPRRNSVRWSGGLATPGTAAGTGSMPVVLLSGFLGAGKTTLLEHLLRGDHRLRLGVIVNDLASVNVDAQQLDGAVKQAGARSVELSNGCVCCSSSEDLRQSILTLSTEVGRELDAIVVELSGVAEPKAARDVVEGIVGANQKYVARTVTLVDASAFASDFAAEVPVPGSGSDPGHPERLSALLAEQIEDAELVVLSKADIAASSELRQAEAMARALNQTAEVHVANHGQLPAELLLPRVSGRMKGASPAEESHASSRSGSPVHSGVGQGKTASGHDVDCSHGDSHGHGHGHGHVHDHGHEDCNEAHSPSSSAERRFGIRSFVYTAQRPFSRYHFMMLVQKWQRTWINMGRVLALQEETISPVEPSEQKEPSARPGSERSSASASPLGPVLRSKGLLWMSTQPRQALRWSHAGRCLKLTNVGPWGQGSTPPASTELVFIGAGLDEGAVRKALDECLVSDEEFSSLTSDSSPREASL